MNGVETMKSTINPIQSAVADAQMTLLKSKSNKEIGLAPKFLSIIIAFLKKVKKYENQLYPSHSINVKCNVFFQIIW